MTWGKTLRQKPTVYKCRKCGVMTDAWIWTLFRCPGCGTKSWQKMVIRDGEAHQKRAITGILVGVVGAAFIVLFGWARTVVAVAWLVGWSCVSMLYFFTSEHMKGKKYGGGIKCHA